MKLQFPKWPSLHQKVKVLVLHQWRTTVKHPERPKLMVARAVKDVERQLSEYLD